MRKIIIASKKATGTVTHIKNVGKEKLELAAGLYFTAKIRGDETAGVVQKEGDNYFLCQNTHDGSECRRKFGYKLSWTINSGKPHELANGSVNVTDLKLFKSKPKGVDIPTRLSEKQMDELEEKEWVANPTIGSYNIRYTSKGVKFGCTEVPARKVLLIAEMMKKEMKRIKRERDKKIIGKVKIPKSNPLHPKYKKVAGRTI